MFWRFGLHSTSSLDSLLDREDLTLQELLDEDDLLQECKAPDSRLIAFLSRVDILKQLFDIITDRITHPESNSRHASTATEVLCSDIPAIVETCLTGSPKLLLGFWDKVLGVPPEKLKLQRSVASHFSKINSVFINKKPVEMFTFIKSLPGALEKILTHVESSHMADLLVRISQFHDHPSLEGVLPWLSSQGIISKLVGLLSPQQGPFTHSLASDLIKTIIILNSQSSGQPSVTDGFQSSSSNQFAGELAAEENIKALFANIVDESFGPDELPVDRMPNSDSRASSKLVSMNILIELIRKNNSDDSESYLFHTLRNRLIHVQQSFDGLSGEDPRETLERAMNEMTEKTGVVQLNTLLCSAIDHLPELKNILIQARRSNLSPPVGHVKRPLTFERLRACELFVELLHCSNTSLLNRRRGSGGPDYDHNGHLLGGLAALEQLAHAVASSNSGDNEAWQGDSGDNEMEPAKELPISGSSHGSMPLSSPSLNSEDSFSDGDEGVSSDGSVEDMSIDLENSAGSISGLNGSETLTSTSSKRSRSGRVSNGSTSRNQSKSRSRSRSELQLHLSTDGDCRSCADKFKYHIVQAQVLPTMIDLFFEFPWNNILHSVVCNMIHQVLLSGAESAESRELIVALFRDGRLLHRIVEAHADQTASPTRVGYMGHLSVICDDVLSALERFSTELKIVIMRYAPQPEWNNFLNGTFKEIKKKESTLLGGTKPMRSLATSNGLGDIRWSKMEDDDNKVPIVAPPTLKGTFRRAESLSHLSKSTAQFAAAAPVAQSEGSTSHFEQYLAEEISSNRRYGQSADDNSDDDEEEAGWLSQSQFNLPSSVSRLTGNLSAGGFDDDFTPSFKTLSGALEGPLEASGPENSEFGPFTDSAAVDFGDFGDFQNADESDGQGMDGSWYLETEDSNTNTAAFFRR